VLLLQLLSMLLIAVVHTSVACIWHVACRSLPPVAFRSPPAVCNSDKDCQISAPVAVAVADAVAVDAVAVDLDVMISHTRFLSLHPATTGGGCNPPRTMGPAGLFYAKIDGFLNF